MSPTLKQLMCSSDCRREPEGENNFALNFIGRLAISRINAYFICASMGKKERRGESGSVYRVMRLFGNRAFKFMPGCGS